jgi:23S rRNA pseudouridine2605 synthase
VLCALYNLVRYLFPVNKTQRRMSRSVALVACAARLTQMRIAPCVRHMIRSYSTHTSHMTQQWSSTTQLSHVTPITASSSRCVRTGHGHAPTPIRPLVSVSGPISVSIHSQSTMYRRPAQALFRTLAAMRSANSDTDNNVNEEVAASKSDMYLAKYIARSGICSRREALRRISNGAVTIDGKSVIDPTVTVHKGAKVEVDGKRAQLLEPQLWAYHKPIGEIVTYDDPKQRPTVFDSIRRRYKHMVGKNHLISVGRLDIFSEGLLLVTNHGALANYLMSPDAHIVREYSLRIKGRLLQRKLDILRRGIMLDGIKYRPMNIQLTQSKNEKHHWLRIVLQEGKNRELRHIFGSYLKVYIQQLIRNKYGPFELRKLAPGQLKEMPIPQSLLADAEAYDSAEPQRQSKKRKRKFFRTHPTKQPGSRRSIAAQRKRQSND